MSHSQNIILLVFHQKKVIDFNIYVASIHLYLTLLSGFSQYFFPHIFTSVIYKLDFFSQFKVQFSLNLFYFFFYPPLQYIQFFLLFQGHRYWNVTIKSEFFVHPHTVYYPSLLSLSIFMDILCSSHF